MPQKWVIAPNGGVTNEPPWGSTMKIETGAETKSKMPQKWVIAPNGGVLNEPPWGSTLKIWD